MHRSLFEHFGNFDPELSACEDYDLWLRICRHLPVGLESSQSLIKYGGHADQLSMQYEVMDRFRIYAMEKSLASEISVYFRAQTTAMLNNKRRIVELGAQKRDCEK